MKRILVTGGSGAVGKWVVRHLLDWGFSVTNADLRPSEQAHTIYADLTEAGQAYGVVAGHDAMVHLAAIPWPREHPPEVVFRTNTQSTFNLLQAASALGVKKIVLASSEQVLGFGFPQRPFTPHYVPIDEAHARLAQDPYGLSKIVMEELAAGFVRRDPGMSILCLRFAWVFQPGDYQIYLPQVWADPKQYRNSLWGYIDARDVATACRLALQSPQPGYDAFFIAAPDTLAKEPTRELLSRYLPGDYPVSEDFTGRQAVLNSSRAQRLLGFEPQYTWSKLYQPEGL